MIIEMLVNDVSFLDDVVLILVMLFVLLFCNEGDILVVLTESISTNSFVTILLPIGRLLLLLLLLVSEYIDDNNDKRILYTNTNHIVKDRIINGYEICIFVSENSLTIRMFMLPTKYIAIIIINTQIIPPQEMFLLLSFNYKY